jgi:hypothetical protein
MFFRPWSPGEKIYALFSQAGFNLPVMFSDKLATGLLIHANSLHSTRNTLLERSNMAITN